MSCNIPVEIGHLGTQVRLAAAEWCLREFGVGRVDILRPISKRVVGGPNPCNELMLVPCFWFSTEEDAMWFSLKWS
jgi:hypothetical protein